MAHDAHDATDRQPAEGGREEVDETLRRQQSARRGDEQSERSDDDRDTGSDQQRAEEIAADVAEDNPDPTTRREAIEQALEAEGLSEEGEELGQHNE